MKEIITCEHFTPKEDIGRAKFTLPIIVEKLWLLREQPGNSLKKEKEYAVWRPTWFL